MLLKFLYQSWLFHLKKLFLIVLLAKVSKSLKEFVGSAGDLCFKITEPEELRRVTKLKIKADLLKDIIIDHKGNVDGIKIVLPRVQNWEALGIYVLLPNPLYISSEELKGRLICYYGISQVIFQNRFVFSLDKWSYWFKARCTLVVLTRNKLL